MDLSLDDLIKQKRIGRAPKGGGVRRRGGAPIRGGAPNRGGGGGGPNRGASGKVGGGVRGNANVGRGGKLGGRVANGVAKKGPVAGGVVKKRVADLRLLIGKRHTAAPVRDAREKLLYRAAPAPRAPQRSAPPMKTLDARDRLSSRSKPSTMPVTDLLMSARGKYDSMPRRTLDNRAPVRKPHTYMDMEEQRIRQRSRIPSSGSSLITRTVDNSRPTELMHVDPWDEPSVHDLTRFQNISRTFHSDEWRPSSMPVSSPLTRRIPMGSKRSEPSRSHQPEGYRIVISNLQPSVTHEDIKELFEDIGSLYSSRVVRPGTAEVLYKSLDDAMKAVDTYHNRQLDGQPMKCFLITRQRASHELRHSDPLAVLALPSHSSLPSIIPPLLPHYQYSKIIF